MTDISKKTERLDLADENCLENKVIFSWDFLEDKKKATSVVSQNLERLGYKGIGLKDYTSILCSIFENEKIIKKSAYQAAISLGINLSIEDFNSIKKEYFDTIED
ncbi:hypothetical protein KY321_01370 [Candidatus Woesearchaeota archaeon]|nr:hypothetical protein [Candidatus Woesearchaeota archaeon]